MAVPRFVDFFEAFLRVVQDGRLHSAAEVRRAVAADMHLTEADCLEMSASGKQTRLCNRVAWARTYLDKAGLIETPSRGEYRITDEGRRALASGERIDLHFLEKSDKFRAFRTSVGRRGSGTSEKEKEESPLEILDAAFQQITASLADDLMNEVMRLSPAEFERLVVCLLLRMGYGSGLAEAGMITQQSHDGGIDGIIQEDQLGFSNIYIQAKRWSPDTTVAKPEIQKFVGALQGQQAQKGLFITTASSTGGALRYVANLLGTKVVLVDGLTLTKLMIKHNVGVAVEHVYEIKRIDGDFFTDGL